MGNKILKIIFSVAIFFLILGGVFDQLNQYQKKQIRKSAIEKLSEKTVKSTTYLLDNISKSLSSQSKNKESGNTALQIVNFFHKLLNNEQVQNSAVQYVKLFYSVASPDSIFHLCASLCYYTGIILLTAGFMILIITCHQSAVANIAPNSIDNVKRPVILILQQQAIALHQRAGLIMLLILACCIGGYWVVSREMNSFFHDQRDFYRELHNEYSAEQSDLMNLLQELIDTQNDNNERLMEQLNEFNYWIESYIDELDACYDIDSDDIQFVIEDLHSTISGNANDLLDLYLEKNFTGDDSRQLYKDIKNYVASTTAEVKTFAEAEQARRHNSFLEEINKMTEEVNNHLAYIKNWSNKASDLNNAQTNNLQYVTGENSISNNVKNGTEAMDNLYRTSLPNFVLFLRIAIMAIILAFIYFLLREYRYFSRKATEVEMKIAALSCVNRNSFASSAFVESIVLNDDTTENRILLKSIKKYSKKLKKQDVGKK